MDLHTGFFRDALAAPDIYHFWGSVLESGVLIQIRFQS
jgi:hypothetical protein